MSKKNSIAFKWFETLRNLTKYQRTFVWDRAELMYAGHSHNYWKELGYDSFNQFLNDPDLLIRRSVAYRDILVYKRFVIDFKIPKEKLYGINIGRLDSVANKIGKKEVEEWLDKARELSNADYALEVKHKGRDIKGCKHEHTKTFPSKTVCENCGERIG